MNLARSYRPRYQSLTITPKSDTKIPSFMNKYSFTDTVNFRVNQIENAVSLKQARFFYYNKFKNLLIWNDNLSEAEIKLFKEADASLKEKIFGDNVKDTKPSKKEPKVASNQSKKYSPEVSRNGRSNNQAKLDAMIATLKSSAGVSFTLLR